MEKPTRPPEIGNVDRSGGILATSILALTLVIIFIALRFATRIWLVKRLGWDDWCIVFAGLGHMVGMGLITVQIQNGFGRPAYYLTEHQIQVFMKFSYGEWLQTFATLTFTKISICLLLLRITISKAFNRPLYAAIFILAVSNIVLSLVWISQCRPHLDKAWNTKMPGKCFSKGQLERIIISQAIISIISDFFLSAFPILILRKVKINFRSKVGLCLLMGLGVITGSLSLVRTVLNYQNVTNDPTWLSVPNWYWRTWEVLFGVVAACIPTLRPLYKWLLREYTRLTNHSPEEPNTRSNRSWPRLKKYLTASANKSNTDGQASASVPGSDMILPLQRFSGTGGDHEKAVEQEMHSGFDKGLHIHGDLEIHRSGNPKLERWDSEAQIGGTDGIKEVEDRI